MTNIKLLTWSWKTLYVLYAVALELRSPKQEKISKELKHKAH